MDRYLSQKFALRKPTLCTDEWWTPATHSSSAKIAFNYCFLFIAPEIERDKLVYRLIELFLSTEIFSKRRKIYTWIEEKPERRPCHTSLLLLTISSSPNMGGVTCVDGSVDFAEWNKMASKYIQNIRKVYYCRDSIEFYKFKWKL